jgi:hypothetical protein
MAKRSKPKSKRKPAPPVLNGGPKRDTRWKPGQSGNPETQFKPGVAANPAGRPLGARSKLNEAFLETLHEAWQRHGPAAVEWVAKNDRPLFVQICASLVPRNIKAEIEETKAVYVMSDRPLTEEQWCAEFCDPENYRKNYPDGKLTPGEKSARKTVVRPAGNRGGKRTGDA